MTPGGGGPAAADAPRAPIRLADVAALERELGDGPRQAVEAVVRSGRFILGDEVAAFEVELAARWAVGEVVTCASGTDALALCLAACGVDRGDVVVTSPLAFVSSAEAIVRLGATPRFVDVEPGRLTLCPEATASYLATCRPVARSGRLVDPASGGRVAAILPVHLYGRLADLQSLGRLARDHDLCIVEDAAQAIGAIPPGQRVGALGAAAVSFFPTKNLGAWGDGGAVVTDDPMLARRARLLRVHGRAPDGSYRERGTNSRLDALQAAVLRLKLPRLPGWNARRRAHAQRYAELLAPLSAIALPQFAAGDVVHLYTIRVAPELRGPLAASLAAAGIETRVYYERLLPDEAAFRGADASARDCPVARRAADEVLSIPVHAQLAPGDVARVVGAIERFFAAR